MSQLRKMAVQDYVQKNYPHARIVSYNDPDSGLSFYTADQLGTMDEQWFPLSATLDESGKVVYGGRKGICHTYIEGQTGAGKTTRFVMQAIRALSCTKNKPSFVVTDPHGEIIENLYRHLRTNGYHVKILNCDDPSRSDTYNPLQEIGRRCLREGEIGYQSANRIRRIAEVIQPVQSTKDPTWEIGARTYTTGSILDKVEDVLKGDMPLECLNMYNVLQNHYWLREQVHESRNLMSVRHFKKKGMQALSVQKLIVVTDTAPVTRAGYYSVLEGRYDTFGQPTMYALSSGNSIDIDQFFKEPTIIVIQSADTTVGDALISLLVNDIYSKAEEEGKKRRTKRLDRDIHCFLDEFANLQVAEGPDFIKMLTTSRKFGMFWHMIVQCDAQMDRKFDEKISKIIRANCAEIYLGSQDRDTEVRFARCCGQKTVETLSSLVSQEAPSLTTVELMTPERLHLTPEGEMYVNSDRHPLLHTCFEAFYNCPEFGTPMDLDQIYPPNDMDYRSTAFTPEDIPPEVSMEQLRLLRMLNKGEQHLQTLVRAFPKENVKEMLKELALKKMVTLLDGRMIRINLTEREMGLLEYRTTLPPAPRIEESEFDVREMFGENGKFRAEVERWFNEAQSAEERIYTDLRTHMARLEGHAKVALLEDITCVPSSLLEMSRSMLPFEEDTCQYGFDILEAESLKTEIIRAFVLRNSFQGKQVWNDALKKECNQIERNELLPNSLVKIFKGAYHRFAREMNERDLTKLIRSVKGS